MAGLRVIDAHVHFWDPSVLRYPWLAGEPALAAPFRPSDFTPLTSGAIDAVLFRGASTRGLLTVRSARRMGGGSRLVLIADVSGFSRVSGLDPFVGILVGHASLAPFVDLLLS